MTTVNLTALAEARAKMTPGEYSTDGVDHGCVEIDAVFRPANGAAWERRSDDATGLVATHNAADVLIEVAQAAMRLRVAGSIMTIALRAARTEANATALATAADEERLALDSYDAALAKVSL